MTTLGSRIRAIPSWQMTLAIALLGLGFLIAAQLRSEGPRVRYTSQERSPLIETALGLQQSQDQLKATILELNKEIRDLQTSGEGSAALVRDLNAQLESARVAAGLVALEGPGLVLQLQDSSNPVPSGGTESDYVVTGHDMRTVVEELWLAGAEAIAINGERVTASTAIVDIGGTILVNSAYLAPPYQVTAIGRAGLYDRLSHAQGFVDFIRARAEAFGIQVSFAEPASVVVPAYAGTVTLRYARPITSPAPSESPVPGGSPAP